MREGQGVDRTLLVVDDHHGVADAVVHLLGADAWTDVHRAHDLATAADLAERRRPDLVTVDLEVGGADGLALVAHLAETRPHLPIVVLAADGSAARAVASLQAGAVAFVPKRSDTAQLSAAFAAVLAGHTWLPTDLLGPVIQELLHPPPPDEWQLLIGSLSRRELEVMELMVSGLNRREIAERLVISLNTVRTHVKNILTRLGVHTSLEAVSVALRAGMRPPPEA